MVKVSSMEKAINNICIFVIKKSFLGSQEGR